MSWTLEIVGQDGSTLTVELPGPQFGDLFALDRAQAVGDTEAGVRFTQDLGRTTERISGQWSGLTQCHVRDLRAFFGPNGAMFGARRFKLLIEESTRGMSAAIPAGSESWSGMCQLDQRDLAFSAQPDRRYSLALRFLVAPLDEVELLDSVEVVDAVSAELL